MCTLAVFLGAFEGYPVVVSANRDEALARPAAPPGLLRATAPRAFGGRDLVAGGTWLGLNERGLVAGLLNRRSPAPLDLSAPSRGRLCLAALGAESAEAATRVAQHAARERHNPFSLLMADGQAGFVLSVRHGEAPQSLRLEPGLHVLTNLDVDDPRCPRIAASQRHFATAGTAFAADGDVLGFVGRLRTVLADHRTPLDPRDRESVCLHGDGYGTRSASVLLVGTGGRPTHWFHADGPPCRTPLAAVALPF